MVNGKDMVIGDVIEAFNNGSLENVENSIKEKIEHELWWLLESFIRNQQLD